MLVCIVTAGFYTISSVIPTSENVISNPASVYTDSTDTKIYICPMHPEVISDKPGKCPKCGMKLELKESNNQNESNTNSRKNEGMKNEHKDHNEQDGHNKSCPEMKHNSNKCSGHKH